RFEYDIDMRGQPMSLLAPFGGLKVHNRALLAAIPGQPCWMAPERIAAWWFDLEDFGAEISQNRGRETPGHAPTEIQNDESAARSAHFCFSPYEGHAARPYRQWGSTAHGLCDRGKKVVPNRKRRASPMIPGKAKLT